MRLKKLPDLAVSMGMPAIAVTDTNNMFCALEFSEAASKAGIQPIIGCQVDMTYDPAAATEKPRAPAALVLLALALPVPQAGAQTAPTKPPSRR